MEVLHHVRDTTYREDASRLRTGNPPECWPPCATPRSACSVWTASPRSHQPYAETAGTRIDPYDSLVLPKTVISRPCEHPGLQRPLGWRLADLLGGFDLSMAIPGLSGRSTSVRWWGRHPHPAAVRSSPRDLPGHLTHDLCGTCRTVPGVRSRGACGGRRS